MMRRVRWSLVFCVSAWLACERPPQPVRDGSHPDMRLQHVAIRSWSGDRLQVVTTATRLDVTRELGTPGDVKAWDAGVTLVGDGTHISAPLVTGNLFAGQFEGTGGVTLESGGGMRAQTPVVAFDRAQGGGGVAASDAGVVMVQPGLRLEATGFVYDLAAQHATFEQPKTWLTPVQR